MLYYELEEELSAAQRAGMLPPLSQDYKESLHTRLQQGTFTMDYDGRYSRQVDPETEQKIISHLKRKMSRRIENRLVDMYQKNQRAKVKDVNSPRVSRSGKLRWMNEVPENVPRDIFKRYNDIGERIVFTPSHNRRVSRNRLKPVVGGSRSITLTSNSFGAPSLLPKIDSDTKLDERSIADHFDLKYEEGEERLEATTDSLRQTSGILITPTHEPRSRNLTLTFQVEEEEPELARLSEADELDTVMEPVGTSDFISPVPTPNIVFRPMTLEQTSLTLPDKHRQILKGRLNIKCPQDIKTVCLYVCGTGQDTRWELSYFMTELYPKLKEYCLQRHCELQIADMHWAMEGVCIDNHSYVDSCTQAIANSCASQCLNFIILTSARYGPFTLPSTIPADEFELIYAAVVKENEAVREVIEQLREQQQEKDEAKEKNKEKKEPTDVVADESKRKKQQAKSQPSQQLQQRIAAKEKELEYLRPDLLHDWFKRDDNSIPAVYRLQRISNKFPDIVKGDMKRRAPAVKQWEDLAQKMVKMLQKFSEQLLQDNGAWKNYFVSLLELEVEAGLRHNAFTPHSIAWFHKQFDGITESDEAAKDFLELNDLARLKMVELSNHLKEQKDIPSTNRETFTLDWIKEGFAPEQLRNHMLYLEKITERIFASVKESMTKLFEEQKQTIPRGRFEQELYTEVVQHVNFCQERARNFHGRKTLLQSIKAYLRSSSTSPLVVYGKSGTGRKSLTCRAARDSHKWCEGGSHSIIFRSCGITSESQNIRQLLKSISVQLCVIYGRDPSTVPTDFRGLVNDFVDRIRYANADQPVVLVVDSLDQLTDEHDARKLSWMPKELPEHVKVIFSCLPDEKYNVLDSAKRIWGSQEANFVEIGQMPVDDAGIILSHWLSSAHHTLTDDQFDSIMRSYNECPNPLFLRCGFQEALRWTSSTPQESFKLPSSVKRVATIAFARLERDHGELFVRRALGYITAARKGITQNELEDLLSLDEPVMDELSAIHRLSIRRCPPALVVRFRQDLGNYVTELAADDLKTMQWAHTQFAEAASERYLQQRDKAPSYHKALAEYFLGTWAHCKKPFGADEEGKERYVASQQLSFEVMGASDKIQTIYNKRALNELPFHFINSNQFDMLKSQCLCNYEWLLAKLSGCSIRNIMDDLHLAITIEPKDRDLNLLMETLQLSRSVLERDSRQLGSQLAGRLRLLIARDVPVAPADPLVYPACHPLLNQISKSSIPTFFPSTTCLTPPGGTLADVMVGHKGEITGLCVATDGMRAVSTSKDNTMKMWDLRSGKVTQTIYDVGVNVLKVLLAFSNSIAITSETTCIRVWDLLKGKCIFTITDFHDYANLAVSSDGRILVCYFVGTNIMRSYSLSEGCKLLKEHKLEDDESRGISKDKLLVISQNTSADLLLIAYQDDNLARSQNIKTGALVHTLKCSEESARINSLTICTDYFAIGYRFKYLKREMPYSIDIFSTSTASFVRSIRGCSEDNINQLMINNMGSHAMCVSTSEYTGSSDLAVWNLETEEHKHLASHAGVSHVAALTDFKYVVTSCKGHFTLRVWNLSGSIVKPALKVKQSVGVSHLVPMKDHPRYVVAACNDNGPLCVWNVAKGRTSGAAVRIEHGLIDPQDIVIIRNTKAVILSDRGFAGSTNVFQSVYIYDLRTKRYERKVPGVYIIPSRPHEFKMLSDDYLLGLSENRNQFYIWNLSTGTIAYRIKPNFTQKVELTQQLHQQALALMKKRQHTAKMTAWDRRCESVDQRQQRQEAQLELELHTIEERRREKENGVEQFLLSGDEKVLVASFFAHHLCVFDLEKKDHIQTLDNENSLLHLYVAALTYDGRFLVHTNYDEDEKVGYVTLWDCFEGNVRKRLKHENDVCAIGISDNADRILYGKANNELRIWEPFRHDSLRKIQGYLGMNFQFGKNKIFILKGGSQAIIYAGDISMWDLEKGVVLAVYTPDVKINCMTIAMDGQLLCFGLADSRSVVCLRLIDNRLDRVQDLGQNIFGENTDSDSSEEEAEEH